MSSSMTILRLWLKVFLSIPENVFSTQSRAASRLRPVASYSRTLATVFVNQPVRAASWDSSMGRSVLQESSMPFPAGRNSPVSRASPRSASHDLLRHV